MRACLFLTLLVATAAADPLGDYRTAVRKLRKQTQKYWSEFPKRFRSAHKTYLAPTSGRGGQDPEATYEFTDLRDLFNDHRLLQQTFAKADAELAKTGTDKAYAALLRELLATCREIDAAAAEFVAANPVDSYLFDQRPGVRIDGLEVRRLGLVAALAGWAELATTGWKRAKKLDGRRSVQRRVSVIDALGLGGKDLSTFVTAKEAPVRVAVAETLFDRKRLEPLLRDKSAAVRRALLQAIRAKGADDPGWIAPVLDYYKQAHGRERTDALSALTALTGQPFGHDAAKWSEWLAEYRKEIDGGGFDKKEIEVQEVKPKPSPDTFRFYGIASESHRVVILVDDSSVIHCPVDWEVRRKNDRWSLRNTRKRWESETVPSHYTYLKRQLDGMLDRFPAKALYGLVLMQGLCDATPSKRMLGLASKDVKLANKQLSRLQASGWCSIMIALDAAVALAPDVDTIFVVHSGELRGGRLLSPELTVAAFKRWNRFRRIVLHAIQIDNQKEPGETLMKGLAEVSGGSYVWLKAPAKG